MSETIRTLIESLLMIAAITGGLVWYAVIAGKREGPITRASSTAAPRAATLNKPVKIHT